MDDLLLGGHGRAWIKALVVYLEEGLKQGQPRGVKRLKTGFSPDFDDGDGELLMDVLARGGAPELEELGELWCRGYCVHWSPQAQWLFNNKVTGKNGACPKLIISGPR